MRGWLGGWGGGIRAGGQGLARKTDWCEGFRKRVRVPLGEILRPPEILPPRTMKRLFLRSMPALALLPLLTSNLSAQAFDSEFGFGSAGEEDARLEQTQAGVRFDLNLQDVTVQEACQFIRLKIEEGGGAPFNLVVAPRGRRDPSALDGVEEHLLRRVRPLCKSDRRSTHSSPWRGGVFRGSRCHSHGVRRSVWDRRLRRDLVRLGQGGTGGGGVERERTRR